MTDRYRVVSGITLPCNACMKYHLYIPRSTSILPYTFPVSGA